MSTTKQTSTPTEDISKESCLKLIDENKKLLKKIHLMESSIKTLSSQHKDLLGMHLEMQNNHLTEMKKLHKIIETKVNLGNNSELKLQSDSELPDDESTKKSIGKRIINNLFTAKLEFTEVIEKYSDEDWFYTVALDLGATNSRISFNIFTRIEQKNSQNSSDEENEQKTEKNKPEDLFSAKNMSQFTEYKTIYGCKCAINSAKSFYFFLEKIHSEIVIDILKGKCAVAGVLAAAGPVGEDKTSVCITNYDADSNLIELKKCPKSLFPIKNSTMIGDVEACCFGIIGIDYKNKLPEFFERVHLGDGKAKNKPVQLRNHHYGVLAVGTGLGAGYILAQTHRSFGLERKDLKFDVIPLELGHVTVPHQGKSKKNFDRIEFLNRQIHSYRHSAEFEDIVSGRGIMNCFAFEINKNIEDVKTTPEMIAKTYHKNEKARQALLTYFNFLMKAAQNMCIMAPNTYGVFLCGDNQVSNMEFYKEYETILHQMFFDHPKQHWLKKVSFYNQIKYYNFNIEGVNYFIKIYYLSDVLVDEKIKKFKK